MTETMLTLPQAIWWTLLALAAGTGAGFLLGRRALTRGLRSRHEELSSECVAIALLAIEAGDHARALGWLQHARVLAPANATLAAQEAWCLGELGRVDEALESYAVASFLSTDGMADFDAALLVLRTGGEHGKAEQRLAMALARSPELALEARGLDEFRPLRGRDAYERAMAKALARLKATPPSRRRP